MRFLMTVGLGTKRALSWRVTSATMLLWSSTRRAFMMRTTAASICGFRSSSTCAQRACTLSAMPQQQRPSVIVFMMRTTAASICGFRSSSTCAQPACTLSECFEAFQARRMLGHDVALTSLKIINSLTAATSYLQVPPETPLLLRPFLAGAQGTYE